MAIESSEASNPLAEWQTNFKKDVLCLRQLMLVRTRHEDEAARQEMYPLFQSVSESLSKLDRATTSLLQYVNRDRAELARLKELQQVTGIQKRRIELIKHQMPDPVAQTLGVQEIVEPDVSVALAKENAPPVENAASRPSQTAVSAPLVEKTVSGEKRRLAAGKKRAKSIGKGEGAGTKEKMIVEKAGQSGDGPVVRPVSSSELSSAPQYVKGRLTLEKIETVVAKLTEIAQAKYKLLRRPYRDLNSGEITQVQAFRENECTETAEKKFITDYEIKGFGEYRMDATVKSVINVLRHVGSLKEVRGKNKVRIYIIS